MIIPEHEPSPLTDLKPGDIITAYTKGFHEVVAVERRFFIETDFVNPHLPRLQGKKPGDEYNPLIYYRRRINSNGGKAPNQIHACDLEFCAKLTQATIDKLYANALTAAKKVKNATELLLGEIE